MAEFLKEKFKEWEKQKPAEYLCTHLKPEGTARPLFLEGINGTHFFVWVGIPEGADSKNKVPGMVLVHGGLGTAFAHWVNFWVKQGYAAIAMDTCGGMPHPDGRGPDIPGHWPRHGWSGAPGWGAFEEQLDWPKENQWFCHAVSTVILSHNYLRSLPEVDAARIGITGVSWGGVLTLMAAGLDHRFQAACPVYSCGWLFEQEEFRRKLRKGSEDARHWWKNEWDPCSFLADIRCPVLWFASTNDGTIFPPRQWQRSTDAVGALSERCLVLRLRHSHGTCSEEQPEIVDFFQRHLANGKASIRLSPAVVREDRISLSYSGGTPRCAMLLYTQDTSENWFLRQWMELSAEVLPSGTVQAELPEHWTAAALALVTQDYLRITSGYVFHE